MQLYIRDVFASVARPIKELKGFELISLNPKEKKTVNFTLTDKELGFYNNTGEFIVEPGLFEVFVGGSSKTALNAKFEIK